MIRIAIVEDEPESREQLIRYLRRYEDENDVKFQVTEYKDGLDILDEYGGQFDLILLDIRMKFVDGMETARKIREKDRNVIIVFITNMAQYAIQGYDVEARGFILKPVRYSAFSQQIARVCRELESREDKYINIQLPGGMRSIRLRDILYIENESHYLHIHLKNETVVFYCTIKEMEQKLEGGTFCRCNNGIIVNLSHVTGIENNTAAVGEEKLPISRSRKKMFIEQLTRYIGEGKYV